MPDWKNLADFTILGPGGVGGLLAGLLARAGNAVTVVASETTAPRIAADGLRVESPVHGDITAPVTATPRLDAPTDVLFVTTKGTSLEPALERVPPEHLHDALVVPLLNGFEHVDLLRARYPRAHVLPAAIHVGAERVAPGRIRHTSPYNRVEIGRAGAVGDGAERLAAALRAAGVAAELVDDGDGVLWRKYAFLLPTALVCAHARLPVGAARQERRTDMLAVLDDVARVAAARGVHLDTEDVVTTIDARPAGTRPSLLVDRENGDPMEIDALGGALLRAARRAGVDVATTARLVADLHAVDTGRASRNPGTAGWDRDGAPRTADGRP